MSTLKTVNIQHPSSASVNAGTDTSGNFLINSGYGSVATAYGCRAWVNFNGTLNVSPATTPPTNVIRASGNVSSITDNGVGDYTVNFTNAMPDANYSAVAISQPSTGVTTITTLLPSGTYTANAVQLRTTNTSGTSTDQTIVCVAVFR